MVCERLEIGTSSTERFAVTAMEGDARGEQWLGQECDDTDDEDGQEEERGQ